MPFMWWAFDRGWISEPWLHSPEPWRVIHLACAALACACTAWLASWTLRQRTWRPLRWLFVGSLLSLVPVCGSFPSSRLTLLASLGFLPLMAAFIGALAAPAWSVVRGAAPLVAR